MATYLVERYFPGRSEEELRSALARVRAASDRMEEEGVAVRYLGSLFLPSEEACFCWFEGPSADAVAEANGRALLPFAHITAAVLIGSGQAGSVRPRRRGSPETDGNRGDAATQ